MKYEIEHRIISNMPNYIQVCQVNTAKKITLVYSHLEVRKISIDSGRWLVKYKNS